MANEKLWTAAEKAEKSIRPRSIVEGWARAAGLEREDAAGFAFELANELREEVDPDDSNFVACLVVRTRSRMLNVINKKRIDATPDVAAVAACAVAPDLRDD